MQRQLIAIMLKAGKDHHKWCTNDNILFLIPGEWYTFENKIESKTLGVSWNPKEACFIFRVKVELSYPYTKRQVLSTTNRIFDQKRLLVGVIEKAKILIQ